MATIARLHGLNANVVYRWRIDERNAGTSAMQGPSSGFVAFNIISETRATAQPLMPADIRVKVTRANTTVVVKWPLQGGAACAAWLRDRLR